MPSQQTINRWLTRYVERWGDQFDYSQIDSAGSEKLRIICREHGPFEVQYARDHMGASGGCGGCWRIALAERNKNRGLTQENFVSDCIKVHGGKYDYSLLAFNGTKSNIVVICPEHGEFTQKAEAHRSGRGCHACGNDVIRAKVTDTTADFIRKSEAVHGKRFDYSGTDYRTAHTRVTIVCSDHGPFEQLAYTHVAGQVGCSKCHSIRKSDWQTKSTENFVREAGVLHAMKYNYDRCLYVGSKKKVLIICPQHGIFEQTPNSHLSGQGCPRCQSRVSRPSDAWLDSLSIEDLRREFRIPGTRYVADGYSPALNTVYLFHGDFWHGNPSTYDSDAVNPRTRSTFGALHDKTVAMERQLVALGYDVLVVWESEWKNLLPPKRARTRRSPKKARCS